MVTASGEAALSVVAGPEAAEGAGAVEVGVAEDAAVAGEDDPHDENRYTYQNQCLSKPW